MTQNEQHLWDSSHRFYGGENRTQEFASWAEFQEIWPINPDYNHLYRWDWATVTYVDGRVGHKLFLYFVLPRKNDTMGYRITVTPDDEPSVRAWLTQKARHVADMWAPVSAIATEEGVAELPTARQHVFAVDALGDEEVADSVVGDPRTWKTLLDATRRYLLALDGESSPEKIRERRDALATGYTYLVNQLADY